MTKLLPIRVFGSSSQDRFHRTCIWTIYLSELELRFAYRTDKVGNNNYARGRICRSNYETYSPVKPKISEMGTYEGRNSVVGNSRGRLLAYSLILGRNVFSPRMYPRSKP